MPQSTKNKILWNHIVWRSAWLWTLVTVSCNFLNSFYFFLGMEHNFRKIATLNQGTPYDYNSVMQYHRWESVILAFQNMCARFRSNSSVQSCLSIVELLSPRMASPPWSLSPMPMFPLVMLSKWVRMTLLGSKNCTSAVSDHRSKWHVQITKKQSSYLMFVYLCFTEKSITEPLMKGPRACFLELHEHQEA